MIELTYQNLFCIKPLSLKHDENCKVFMCSDLHHNHNKEFLFEKRGYKSVEEHDEGMIKRWNNKISNNDVVFHLGDIQFGENGQLKLMELLKRLNFKTLLCCPGNHHSGYKQLFNEMIGNGNDIGNFDIILDGDKQLIFIPNYFEIIINKQPIVLCHYGLASWNGMGGGRTFLVFGHSHNSLSIDLGKAIDVGFENPLSPISFDELTEYMKSRESKSPDHHSEHTSTSFH